MLEEQRGLEFATFIKRIFQALKASNLRKKGGVDANNRGFDDPGLSKLLTIEDEPLMLDPTSDPTTFAFMRQAGSDYKAGTPSTGLHQASHDLSAGYWMITSIQDSTGRRYNGRLSFCAMKVESGSSAYASIRIIIGSSIHEVGFSFGGEKTLRYMIDNCHVRILSKFGADTGVLASFPYAVSSSSASIQLWQSSTEIKTWLVSLLWLQSPRPEGVQNMTSYNSYWPALSARSGWKSRETVSRTLGIERGDTLGGHYDMIEWDDDSPFPTKSLAGFLLGKECRLDSGKLSTTLLSPSWRHRIFMVDELNYGSLWRAWKAWRAMNQSNFLPTFGLDLLSTESPQALILLARFQHSLMARNWQPQSSGKKRVCGQCRCGYRFVDEFMELRPAAAADYENLLQERSSHLKGYHYPVKHGQDIQDATDAGDTNSQSERSTAVPIIGGGPTIVTSSVSSLPGKRRSESTLPQYQLKSRDVQRKMSLICNNELLFLLLCIPQHQFATRLLQPQISDITSDQGFFLLLRRNYQQMRGRMRRVFSMRTIRSIKFVQLEMYKSELVDIRKLDDLPPEDKRDEYRYNPVPAEIIPPVGENHMLHLINHPTHAEEDAFVLDRIPKKLKERLLVSPSRGTGLGWGIYFIEGWHLSVITLVAFAVLLAGSLAFLICWSVLEHDLQGASGVAAYMVAFLGLAIGSTQAVFELT